tara:strand:- start:55 stop:252 length:198 start_codon:yes stop_codon:yes gene_type:complete
MSAHDPDIIKAHNDGFAQGESFGHIQARRGMLSVMRRIQASLADGSTDEAAHLLGDAIADLVETT